MLTVHHLAASQSERIVWLCEELALPYELVRYERDPQTRAAPPEYRALHPFGTAPVITDGALTLGESGAIVEYLARTHAGGRLIVGPDDPAYADYLFWFHFANGSLVPSLMSDYIRPPADPVDPGTNRTARAFAMIERRLAHVQYFAGSDFTAADIMMALPRFGAMRDLAAYPAIRAYLKRITERPAYRAAMAEAEPNEDRRFD